MQKEFKKERLTKDVRYQERAEVTLDCGKQSRVTSFFEHNSPSLADTTKR